MQRINRNIPLAQSRRDMPPRKRASDIRKGYLGDGFQRAAFGFFQGAVQRGAGSLGMSAAASLYQSVIGFILVLTTNLFVNKLNPDNALF